MPCNAYQHLILNFVILLIMRKRFQNFSILTSIVIFSTLVIVSQAMIHTVFAEEYDFVAGIHTEVTFHFRDGPVANL